MASAITPIFLLILTGNLLRRLPPFEPAFWRGLDRLGFYVLYPALLFVTVLQADFGTLSLSALMTVLLVGWGIVALVALALWPALRSAGVSRATFSTVFQSSIRWNGFMALAVAENLFPPQGLAVVALVMAAIVIPINVTAISVVAWFTDAAPSFRRTAWRVMSNPLVIGTGAALVIRALPFDLPQPVMDALHLIGRAALGMGLMAIGAGLRADWAMLRGPGVLVPVVLKMALMPAVVVGLALAVGIRGPELTYLALCATMPTALNGYVIAREMGGDAETYAATATLQTAVAFFSIPATLWLVGLLPGA